MITLQCSIFKYLEYALKIVLVRPDYDVTVITPHLGMGYLSSFLKAKGIEVIIIDNLLLKLDNSTLIKKILSVNPDCVGITCLSAFFNEVKELSLQLKASGLKTIVGGVHPTFLPYSTLIETKCDFVICGEGEIALSELLLRKFDNTGIQGVYSLKDLNSDDEKFLTGATVENLDDIPFPDWEQMKPAIYPMAPMGTVSRSYPVVPIMTSRGCTGCCKFCASPNFYQRRIRFRSPENVIEEIKLLVNKYGANEIQFIDDNPIVNPEYAHKLYTLMRENNIKIPWSCINGIRADSLTKEMALLMKKAGCYQVVVGIESANNSILKTIGKNETIEQINNSINILNEVGITTRGNFIFGLPGETIETIKETIDFAINSKLDRAFFSVLDIIPGCTLWKEKKGQYKLTQSSTSFVKPNWIPEGLTESDLVNALSLAYRKFYSKPTAFFSIIKDLKLTQLKYILIRMTKFGIFKRIKNT